MKRARAAVPVESDHRGRDHFVYITHVSYSNRDPIIRPQHAEFFECYTEDNQHDHPRFGCGPHQPIQVTKNVYNLTPVFKLGAGIAVNKTVRDILASSSLTEFRLITIHRAYWYPYAPGDMSFEMSGVNTDASPGIVSDRFARAFACASPRECYYEVITPTAYLHGGSFVDVEMLRLATDAPEACSVYAEDVQVSREMISEYGLVFSGGFLCRPDLFELLNPYLHRPWFWTRRYAYQ